MSKPMEYISGATEQKGYQSVVSISRFKDAFKICFSTFEFVNAALFTDNFVSSFC